MEEARKNALEVGKEAHAKANENPEALENESYLVMLLGFLDFSKDMQSC